MTWMPGESVSGPLPRPTTRERALAARLESDVLALSEDIGERNLLCGDSMDRSAAWIGARMRDAGFSPQCHTYALAGDSLPMVAGREAHNLVAEVRGRERVDEIVVFGAHYDSVSASPGANDNASGVAALLALAEAFGNRPQPRTLRFVAFANEEPPYFLSRDMGSLAYAARCRARGENIVAMMAMDGIGYFSDEPGSQQFPVSGVGWMYPDRGNFIGFVSRVRDVRLLRRAIGAFRERATVPSEGAALPAWVPGVGWSDHWSFWQNGYPASFVTDTLPFRDPHYHSPDDTAERLDYDRMARVVAGLEAVIPVLAGSA